MRVNYIKGVNNEFTNFLRVLALLQKSVYSAETGAVSASLYAVKCGLKITVPLANQNGARRTQAVTFDSPGTSLQNAINNAADVAQWIADNSDGYITMFTMQLGLYRPDVEGTPMQAGELSYASLGGC